MKKLLIIILLLITTNLVFADKKITELPELTAPTTSDLLIAVDDVAGTPTTKKMLIDNLLNTELIDHLNIKSTGTYSHSIIDNKIDDLDVSTASLRTDLDTVIISTGALEVRITDLETSTATLEGYISDLWTSTASLRTDVDALIISTGTFVKYTDSVDVVADVDTTSDLPSQNEVLKWNGSNWVPGTAGDTGEFTFSIASFADDQSNTQLIGSGIWKAIGGISFTASYNNGPPDTSSITLTSNGGVTWGSTLDLSSPFTSTSTIETTDYTTSKDQYVTFTLNSKLGDTSDSDTETVYFRNIVYWGSIAKADTFTEADIEGLSGSAITNDFTRTETINAGAGEYIVLAYPTNYTAMDEGDDYEDDGGTDFKFNSIALAMIQDNASLSITNSAGFTENYDVYVSSASGLGNHTFVNHTSDQTIDPLYYGVTSTESGFSEADVEGLEKNEVTNDNTQVWDEITAGGGEYLLFAFPKRLGTPSFKDYSTGFAISWVDGAPETVSVMNSNAWTEDYYVWRSNQPNLGAITVESY